LSINRQKELLKTNAPLVWRVFAFMAAFILLSGVIGPRIIGNGLVDKNGFQVYGGAGKSLLFGAAALAVLVARKGVTVKLDSWRYTQAIWFVLAILAFGITWHGIGLLIAGSPSVPWVIAVHACLLGSVVCAAVGSFGLGNVRSLAGAYKQELMIAFALAVAFDGFLYAVYGLWQVLAAAVLHAVGWLLRLVGISSVIVPPRTLVLSKFGIEVAQYCSGIESIALFSGLYTFVGVLDWPRLNHRKYLAVFIPALVALFGFNILRVFLLILGGYYINPHIAFSLFHTYAGMVLFIIYSGLFWALSYKWMLDKR
jgi:exosortase/archaeosortase family protein